MTSIIIHMVIIFLMGITAKNNDFVVGLMMFMLSVSIIVQLIVMLIQWIIQNYQIIQL